VKGGGAWSRQLRHSAPAKVSRRASETRGGWTVGVGANTRSPTTDGLVEYNYYDLQSHAHVLRRGGRIRQYHIRERKSVIRGGLTSAGATVGHRKYYPIRQALRRTQAGEREARSRLLARPATEGGRMTIAIPLPLSVLARLTRSVSTRAHTAASAAHRYRRRARSPPRLSSSVGLRAPARRRSANCREIPCLGHQGAGADQALLPIFAPLSTIAPMPMSCSIRRCSRAHDVWPMTQFSPMTRGKPGSVCKVELSWICERSPSSIQSCRREHRSRPDAVSV